MRFFIFIFLLLTQSVLNGQSLSRVNEYLHTLTDSSFYGRGYVNQGSNLAAEYLSAEFENIGLRPAKSGFLQKFQVEVNTYPSEMRLSIDGKELIPGYDFIVDPNTGSSSGTWEITEMDSSSFQTTVGELPDGLVPLVNMAGIDTPEEMDFFHQFKQNVLRAYPLIQIEEKLTWSVGQQRSYHSAISVLNPSIDAEINEIEISVINEMSSLGVSNVVGFIPGQRHDSLIVLTAHYDHLGMMGPAIFPGASDNATGTSMLLDLANYYMENTPEYDTWFIAFAAEEAGLVGSKYFVDHPLFDLDKMKVLINLDLMGSASKGIAIVNGKKFPKMISAISDINEEKNLVDRIKVRGQAANSDHYWFAEKGLPAIFIYTMGGITAYHDVYDTPKVIDWAKYPEVFTLITEFIATR